MQPGKPGHVLHTLAKTALFTELCVHQVINAPPGVPIKLCRRCNQHKPLTDFYRSKANADGYDGRCKACDAIQCAERRRKKARVEVRSAPSPSSLGQCPRASPASSSLLGGLCSNAKHLASALPGRGAVGTAASAPAWLASKARGAGAHSARQGVPAVQRLQGGHGVLPQQDQP